jgi:hypothetical protein
VRGSKGSAPARNSSTATARAHLCKAQALEEGAHIVFVSHVSAQDAGPRAKIGVGSTKTSCSAFFARVVSCLDAWGYGGSPLLIRRLQLKSAVLQRHLHRPHSASRCPWVVPAAFDDQRPSNRTDNALGGSALILSFSAGRSSLVSYTRPALASTVLQSKCRKPQPPKVT